MLYIYICIATTACNKLFFTRPMKPLEATGLLNQ